MELLKRLNESFSASGYEEEIKSVVVDYLSQWYAITSDALGNVIATKKGTEEHLVFCAPMDSGGYYLNHEKDDKAYSFTKLSSASKGKVDSAKARTYSGIKGTFSEDGKTFVSDEKLVLPTVADIIVPFSVSEYRINSRHGDLYGLLLLAERLKNVPQEITVVALAQTSLRQRGVFGMIPASADLYVLIELLENRHVSLGDGAVLCLKDGAYICPQTVKEKICMFDKMYVGEEKPSLAFELSRQGHGRRVASIKIPAKKIGTTEETFCMGDVFNLCNKLTSLCEKGLTKF